MATRITVRQILRIPPGEITFTYPDDGKPSPIDSRYKTLRVERRGLRKWTSFQENPACLKTYLDRDTTCLESWRPYITAWQRYAATERIVQDLYGLTLITRVNVALDASVRSQNLSIIGTPKHFPSWGTETSRAEGETETTIAPDWAVVYGDSSNASLLAEIDTKVIAWGDTKLSNKNPTANPGNLPDTVSCPEAYLAQVVQYCLDMAIPFGFVLTNYELIVFHLVKNECELRLKPTTRASRPSNYEFQCLPLDDVEEPDFSSPLKRITGDWVEFDDGDDAIPSLICEDKKLETLLEPTFTPGRGGYEPPGPVLHKLPRSLSLQEREYRGTTPEPPDSSQESSLHPGSSPCPPDTRSRRNFTPTTSPWFSSSEPQTMSQYTNDTRGEDPTYVLMKAYRADDEGVAQRLFELCMLGRRLRTTVL
ncbi:hypothetical protein F4859DRAFT_526389 [Xylaria cf. heliscus]|nr:hypothetical protein F4859DRAFT_526389 [Xylaria cf. heliscus]